MKKIISYLIVFILIIKSDIYGQEFLGIKAEGKLSEVVTKFKQKGFKISSPDEYAPILEGKAGMSNVELLIRSTAISKTVYSFSVFLPKKNDWESIKSEYQNYLKTLTDKYGEPHSTYNFFSSPYKEGEGDEMNAIEMEKCNYIAFWKNISIEISKFKQVQIRYENLKYLELKDVEEAKLKKSIF